MVPTFNPPAAIGAILAAALAACDSATLQKLQDQSHGAIEACEAAIKAKLTAPSTYSRISAEYTPGLPLTREEYEAYEETNGCGLDPAPNDPCLFANRIRIAFGSTVDWTKGGSVEQVRKPTKKAREHYLSYRFEQLQKWPEAKRQTAFVQI